MGNADQGSTKAGLAKVEPTYSQRFTAAVVKEFGNEVGVIELSPYQQTLAKHLFIAVDTQLKSLEAKRLEKKQDKAPIVWQNVNMAKLALDAVHRVELGLDALIPNHIHPVPYFNKALKKYDLSLDIGYAGKDCYKRKLAIDPPVDIIYELVHKTDTFKPIKKSAINQAESYEFVINEPFSRGEVIGGFGYIVQEDPTKNQLVIVTKEDMDKSKRLAKSDTFWKAHPKEMQFVVLVRRTTAKIALDPEKINASVHHVEVTELAENEMLKIEENANQEVIDIEPEPEKKRSQYPGDSENDKFHEEHGNKPETVELPTGPSTGGPDF